MEENEKYVYVGFCLIFIIHKVFRFLFFFLLIILFVGKLFLIVSQSKQESLLIDSSNKVFYLRATREK